MAILLQVNYTPASEQAAAAPETRIESAKKIAQLPGFKWKVWIRNDESNLRGGIYLFADRAAAQAWGDQLKARFQEAGAGNVSIIHFDVDEAPSVITHAPLR